MALSVLHRPGEGEGLHRVHRARKLRGRNDPGEVSRPKRAHFSTFSLKIRLPPRTKKFSQLQA